MNPRTIRLKKEARALLAPWLAMVICGMLPAIYANSYTKKLSLISFFFGVPVLAALALGNEFQQRTLTLWITQPFSRARLWREKIGVTLAMAFAAALISGIVIFAITWPHLDVTWRLMAMVCVLVGTASAPYWTLATRSTLGGLVLLSFYFIAAAFLAFQVAPRVDVAPPPPLATAATAAIAILGICYAALTLWLGARKLTRYQVTGSADDADLLMRGPEVMPAAYTRWLRCRPSGMLLNLIRKELRLLRPFWLFTLLALVCLALAAVFGLLTVFPVRPEHPKLALRFVVFVSLGSMFLLAPVFAGLLTLGEERTSGTHAWHMTLPVSLRRQWLIKLAMAIGAGFLSAVVLPVMVVIGVGTFLGSPFMYVDFGELRDWMVMVPLMTFASFWCACAAKGTVRASVWVSTVPAAIIFVRVSGMRLGEDLARTTGTLRDLIVSSFQLSPSTFAAITDSARASVLWLFVPALLVALIQSCRLFRRQPEDNVRWLLRCVAPLAVVTLVWSFSVSAGFVSSAWEPVAETRRALDGTPEVTLKGENLAAVSPLTRRWLAGSTIAVVPSQTGYLATIQLASGVECRLTAIRSGGTVAACASKGP